MTELSIPPLIGVPACRILGAHGLPIHKVSESYLKGVIDGADGLPVMLPAIGDELAAEQIDRWLDAVDGLLLTGSPSNVDPTYYDGQEARRDSERDPARDATTLPLIRRAIERAVPLLAICRGIQELNVALGGTLHQHVHELPGRMDHRSDKSRPIAERFDELAHAITLTEGGALQAILGGVREIEVNTLHAQAIDRPAKSVVVEATAPDGTIEAVSVRDAPTFALGVQWHPEWHVLEDPHSKRLFTAFGDACRARASSKTIPARRAS
ncbi:MAG: gamma-glutamyl-gamma-aminobutyrate hydrolase family protein [Alphaproteobacteria bacterium]|nr:gamma-glutamyl-gamma-aminobutyrate hydrolase family protein [Alphaproteobacteria bacterium]